MAYRPCPITLARRRACTVVRRARESFSLTKFPTSKVGYTEETTLKNYIMVHPSVSTGPMSVCLKKKKHTHTNTRIPPHTHTNHCEANSFSAPIIAQNTHGPSYANIGRCMCILYAEIAFALNFKSIKGWGETLGISFM